MKPSLLRRSFRRRRGGHTIELARSGHCWLCTWCKIRSTSRVKLATSKCSGNGTKPLTTIAATMAARPVGDGRRHILVESGTVQWCDTCGTYAESRTSRRMAGICRGPPPAAAGKGGMRQQLMALRAGRHPVTGMILPVPCNSHAALGSGTYSQLKPRPSGDDSFVPYVPRDVVVPEPSGVSAEKKRWLMRGRLLCRNSKEAALLRRSRRRIAKIEVRKVISSFLGNAGNEVAQGIVEPEHSEQATEDDKVSEEVWASLPVVASRERHVLNIPTKPERCFPGKAVQSRMLLLGSNGNAPAECWFSVGESWRLLGSSTPIFCFDAAECGIV